MEIGKRESAGVLILELQGKLHHGVGDVEFRDALEEALEQGHRKIVIDLDGVKSIDSSGLGELVRAKVTATRRQAEMKLANLNMRAYELLTMSQLVPVFDIYESQEEAVESFE